MAETHYYWRCGIAVPLLGEDEWSAIKPLLRAGIRDVQNYSRRTQAELREALERNQGVPALQAYKDITGFLETNINAIWHHRRSQFGVPCPQCRNLLRTPRAKFCAECGSTAHLISPDS